MFSFTLFCCRWIVVEFACSCCDKIEISHVKLNVLNFWEKWWWWSSSSLSSSLWGWCGHGCGHSTWSCHWQHDAWTDRASASLLLLWLLRFLWFLWFLAAFWSAATAFAIWIFGKVLTFWARLNQSKIGNDKCKFLYNSLSKIVVSKRKNKKYERMTSRYGKCVHTKRGVCAMNYASFWFNSIRFWLK